MINNKKLIKLARKWRRLAAAGRKRISLPRSNNTKSLTTTEKGQFIVYTIDERRFELPLAYLGSQVVRELLRMAEEEFGLAGDGPITLPCDSVFMEYAISMIQQSVAREMEEALILVTPPILPLSWESYSARNFLEFGNPQRLDLVIRNIDLIKMLL